MNKAIDNVSYLKDKIGEIITEYVGKDIFKEKQAEKRIFLTDLEFDIFKKVDLFNDRINELREYLKTKILTEVKEDIKGLPIYTVNYYHEGDDIQRVYIDEKDVLEIIQKHIEKGAKR